MGARLILDTGTLIAAERQRLDLTEAISDTDDVVIPAIAVAEYLAGVHLARTDAQRATRREFLTRVLAILPVEDYTPNVAEHHAELLAHVRRIGHSRGAHDLVIAATAAAVYRTVVTTDNRARFDELPGVTARVVKVS